MKNIQSLYKLLFVKPLSALSHMKIIVGVIYHRFNYVENAIYIFYVTITITKPKSTVVPRIDKLDYCFQQLPNFSNMEWPAFNP